MKPNWVLSEDQCKIRFRNVRKEKMKKEAGVKEEVEELTRLDGSNEDVVLIKKEVKSPVTASEFLIYFLWPKNFLNYSELILTIQFLLGLTRTVLQPLFQKNKNLDPRL